MYTDNFFMHQVQIFAHARPTISDAMLTIIWKKQKRRCTEIAEMDPSAFPSAFAYRQK